MQWMRKINGRVLPATLAAILVCGLLGLWLQHQLKADTNQAPVVSASSSASAVDLLQTIDVTATVTDDGLPSTELTYAWSKVSGPGNVGFDDDAIKDTTAAFSKAGSYVIRLSVSDGDLTGTSDVSVTVNSTIAYTITDLGTLGGSVVEATAINNRGHVIGKSTLTGDTQIHAFFWHSSTMDDLGTLGGDDSAAFGINNGSYVVGESTDLQGDKHAFLWDGITMSDLGTYPNTTGTETSATSIDDLGRVIGTADETTTPKAVTFDGFTWSDLGTLGGSWAIAAANNIRNQITGQAQDNASVAKPFIYTQLDGMLEINPLGGTTGGKALAINAFGDVVGQAANSIPESHAFIYHNNQGKDLGTLGGTTSIAHDVNNLGDVVGAAQDASSQNRAFIHWHGVMVDLNDLIDPSSGWTILTDAKSINDAGQIVGHGTISSQTRAYLLTPVTPQFNTMITIPDDQANFNEGDNVTLHAVAAISNGSINKVSFYEGSNLLGEDTTAPYSFAWNNVSIGNYDITCIATASDTSTVTSDVVHINVLNVNDPPSVVIDAPPSGARYAANANIQITATPTDPDGDETIAKVEYFEGANKLGETTQTPHAMTWSSVTPGDYSVTAKATDSEGLSGTSAPVAITVNTIPQTGMVLWLRSDAGIVLDGNSKIQEWQDQSGNARHLAQAGESARPTLVTGVINGMPAVRFDGVDDALSYSLSTAYTGNSTIHIVLKSNATTPTQNSTYLSTAASSGITGSFELTTDDQSPANLAITQNNSTYQAITSIPDTYQLITIQIEDATAKVFADGALQAEYTISSGDYSTIAGYVLGRNRAGSLFASCDIVELLVYETSQSTTDFASTLTALADEYSLNLIPSITWLTPTDASSFLMGDSATLTVNASDPDDGVSQVEFFANGNSIGLGSDPESDGSYSMVWTPGTNMVGANDVYAVVTDNNSTSPVSISSNHVTLTFSFPVISGQTLVDVPTGEVVSGLMAGSVMHTRDGYLFVASNGPTSSVGKVLVYKRDVSGWVYDTTLNGGVAGDGFGGCLLFDDSQLFVGLTGTNGNIASAVVFTVDTQGTWDSGVAMAIPAEVTAAGVSGSTLVLGENVIAVGSPSTNDRRGVVYIFQKIEGAWTPVQTLTDGEATASDRRFGSSLAVSGNRMLIGATSGHDLDGSLDPVIEMAGAVYVFERADVTAAWSRVDKIQLADPKGLETFGSSVALHGDVAVIGAPGSNEPLYRMGKAYVYSFDGNDWNQTCTLLASDGASSDTFGKSVAIDGDYALVGCPGHDDSGTSTNNVGGVYMYHLPTLNVPSVAISAPVAGPFVFDDLVNGDMLLTADVTGMGTSGGKVEFYLDGTLLGEGVYNAGSYDLTWEDVTWNRHQLQVRAISDEGIASLSNVVEVYATQTPAFDEQRLVANDGTSWDLFGYAVDITIDQATGNEYAIVGAHGDQANGQQAGSVYLFEKVAGTWTQVQKLTGPDPTKYWEGFGFAVAIHGDKAYVGVTQDSTETGTKGPGTVYVYQRSAGSVGTADLWQSLGTPIVAWDNNINGSFGQAIAVNDNYLAIGAPEDDDLGTDSGAVYVFTWSGSSWIQGSKLTAPSGVTNDGYGLSVAMDATHLIVGCPGDDDDVNVITDSGKVYLYALSNLSSAAVLSPADFDISESQADAHFGESVAIDNGLAVIGAASAAGSFDQQGKAYVAKLTDTNTWSTLHILAASDAAEDDSFGVSVAIHDDLIIVGSFGDDERASNTGSVYLFQQPGIDLATGQPSESFIELGKFGASDASPDANFGISMTITSNDIAVGNMLNSQQGQNAGAAYIFRRPKAPTITIVSPLADSQLDNDTDIPVTVQVTANDSIAVSTPVLWIGSTQLTNPVDNGGGSYTFTWHPNVATTQNETLQAVVNNLESMTGASDSVLVQIIANHAPTLTAIATMTGPSEDPATPFEISYDTLIAYASDVDAGDTLSFRVNTIESGTVAINGTAVTTVTQDALNATQLFSGQSFQWQPALNSNGELTAFTVSIFDGSESSATQQITIQVTAVNDAPYVTNTLSNLDIAVNSDPVNVDVSMVFADVDDASLTLTATSSDSLVTPQIVGNTLTLTILANQQGNATITLRAEDSEPLGVETTFDVTVSTNAAPVIQTIPTIVAAYQDTELGIPVDDLLAYVSDANDDPIQLFVQTLDSGTLKIYNGGSVTVVTRDVDSVNATLLQSGKTLLWTPASGVTGSSVAAFQLIAYDGDKYSSVGQVSVQVLASDAPHLTITPLFYGAVEDTNGFTVPLSSNMSYYGPYGTTTTISIEQVLNGVLYKNGTEVTSSTSWVETDVLTWDPPANESGAISAFTVLATASGVQSALRTVKINVVPVNDPPTLSAIPMITGASEDQPVTITYEQLAAYVSDPDNNASTLSLKVTGIFTGTLNTLKDSVSASAGIGSSILGNESFVWTPPSGGSGDIAAFEVMAVDGQYQSTPQMVKIQVTDQDALPTVSWSTLKENAIFDQNSVITLAATANDAEDQTGTLTVEFLVDDVLQGAGSFNYVTESYNYDWANVSSGDYELTIRVTDSSSHVVTSESRHIHVYAMPTQNLALWLRADQGVTVDGTQHVSQWQNFAYNVPDLIQETATMQPVLLSDQVNSLPAIQFDGVDDVLQSDLAEQYGGPISFFMVMKMATASATDQADVFATSTNDEEGMLGLVVNTSVTPANLKILSDSTSSAYADMCPIPSEDYRLIHWQVTNNMLSIYQDGTLLSQQAISETDLKHVSSYVFGVLNTAGQSFALAECLSYQGMISDAARQNVVANLLTKYSITPVNVSETITMVSPTTPFDFSAGSNVTLEASVVTTDAVTSVEFIANGTSLGTVNTVNGSGNYELAWQPVVNGLYLIKATVTDEHGTVTEGTPLLVNIGLVDSDGDGMPDVWEDTYGLDKNDDTDATLDADSDGISNINEYLSGQNPTQSGVLGYEELVRLIVYRFK